MMYRLCRYMVYMDENGDAEGNYTLIALDNRPTKGHGLYPIAYFVGKENGTNLPVSKTLTDSLFFLFFLSFFFFFFFSFRSSFIDPRFACRDFGWRGTFRGSVTGRPSPSLAAATTVKNALVRIRRLLLLFPASPSLPINQFFVTFDWRNERLVGIKWKQRRWDGDTSR